MAPLLEELMNLFTPVIPVCSKSPHAMRFGPSRATDVGYDLPIWLPCGSKYIASGHSVDLPTGVSIKLPHDVGARIISRSSTHLKLHLDVYEGLIDPGYTGELRICVANHTVEGIKVVDGQRLAQVIFFPVIRPTLRFVDELTVEDNERGNRGFGSTGS